jgi:hypothetical protein
VITSGTLSLDRIPAHGKTHHVSPTLPDDDAHRTASPIDHPDGSVTRAKLEKPTSNVSLGYILNNFDTFTWFGGGGNYCAVCFPNTYGDEDIRILQFCENSGAAVRYQSKSNHYHLRIVTAKSTGDLEFCKWVNGTETDIAREAVDLGWGGHYIRMVASGTSFYAYREDMTTAKFSATDTSFASGYWGWECADYTYPHNSLIWCKLFDPSPQTVRKVLGYYELPVVGLGTPDDPYRAGLPEVLEVPSTNELDGYPTALKQAILGNREGKVNRIAVSWSALIPTDPVTGRPLHLTCLVRVFEQPDRQPHLWKVQEALDEIEQLPQVKKHDERSVRVRAKELDPKLKDKDLEGW